jgi:very-short-patch-repair endonuclease
VWRAEPLHWRAKVWIHHRRPSFACFWCWPVSLSLYDLAYEHLRLIIEYDGRQHAEDSRQWLTDIFRREELDQMRWRLVIVTSEGIYSEPLRTLERVRDALLECGAIGIRRTFKPEWRLHFPAR